MGIFLGPSGITLKVMFPLGVKNTNFSYYRFRTRNWRYLEPASKEIKYVRPLKLPKSSMLSVHRGIGNSKVLMTLFSGR